MVTVVDSQSFVSDVCHFQAKSTLKKNGIGIETGIASESSRALSLVSCVYTALNRQTDYDQLTGLDVTRSCQTASKCRKQDQTESALTHWFPATRRYSDVIGC